jgi:Zn-dependent protease
MNLWEWFLFLVPSVILHEVSHGWVANYFGDPTAKQQHRLTLNPLAHIDPFGTVIMPALLLF